MKFTSLFLASGMSDSSGLFLKQETSREGRTTE